MTKLSYVYTNAKGDSQVIASYSKLLTLLQRQGGHYKAVYEPVMEPFDYKGKKERIKI